MSCDPYGNIVFELRYTPTMPKPADLVIASDTVTVTLPSTSSTSFIARYAYGIPPLTLPVDIARVLVVVLRIHAVRSKRVVVVVWGHVCS